MELEPIVDLDTLEPNIDTTVALSNTENRNIQQEIKKIMASVIEDKYNYETLYDHILTEGEQTLNGLRERAENNPQVHPRDNTPRWDKGGNKALLGNMEFCLELETHLWKDNSDGEERTYTFKVQSRTEIEANGQGVGILQENGHGPPE
ncbi:hypothetical protein COLO4_38026 [Corchorus olitorius]|uniref:Uncharacterized protein n=1 Tax=Corchorus olitorius TaxID=93759 RepID=A0A1R3FXF5_9ROSI|nr:hypothetical protein COLO4_38026 [Corchorus olitorius]